MSEDIVSIEAQKAIALVRNGNAEDAILILSQIVGLKPNDPELQFLLGICYMQMCDYVAALKSFDDALRIEPENLTLIINKGVALRKLGNAKASIDLLAYAIRLDSKSIDAHSQLGNALIELDRFEEAVNSFSKALALDASHLDSIFNIALAQMKLGNLQKAASNFERFNAIAPGDLMSYMNLANLYSQLGNYSSALFALERAAQVSPNNAQILYQVGNLHLDNKQPSKAVDAYNIARCINPSTDGLLGAHAFSLMAICNWDAHAGIFQELRSAINRGELAAHPFHLLAFPFELDEIKRYTEIYSNRTIPHQESTNKLFELNNPKIKIAYLSSDYYNHATSQLISEVIELHDRSAFEVIGICYGHSPNDAARARIANAFDQFIEAGNHTDEAIARIIYELDIDIAIDLKGHTQNSRLGIFSHRPAPIQVHYLGYPGTIGTPCIDYLIADNEVITEKMHSGFSEMIVYLPDSYQCNDRTKIIAGINDHRTDHGLPDRGFVFCCFNNNWKISPDMFNIWMNILERTEGSVLWLLKDNAVAAENLWKQARNRGIDSNRLIFAEKISLDQHLARHIHADLFLDTLYYNAHTTASDALWTELPIITKRGDTYASRVCASLLQAIGLPDLIVNTLEEYEELAVDLATQPTKLRTIREKLSFNRLNTPLFDTVRFTQHLEAAYREMLARHRNNMQPDHIRVRST